jgi:hypothetical protein
VSLIELAQLVNEGKATMRYETPAATSTVPLHPHTAFNPGLLLSGCVIRIFARCRSHDGQQRQETTLLSSWRGPATSECRKASSLSLKTSPR